MEKKSDHEIDFLGIGDITTDAFIELKNAEVNCELDTENCKICMKWGTKIPFKNAVEVPAVGNSINGTFSAKRLGLQSGVITNVGDDDNGKRCIQALKAEDIDTEHVKVNNGKTTNYHYVLSFNAERTILIKHEEYDYSLPRFKKPKYIYLSSLGEKAGNLYEELAEYLDNNKDVNLAFQPGTFQIKIGYEPLKKIYKNTKVFFCNREEAQRILNTDNDEIKNLLTLMYNLGPEIVVITDGPKGAYTYDGEEMIYMPPYPDPKPPVERTGAGDSFSSTFTSFLAIGMSQKDAIIRAPINSMSVVQYIGAREGLLTKDKIELLLGTAPKDYRPKVL